jgi:hypothetical protein
MMFQVSKLLGLNVSERNTFFLKIFLRKQFMFAVVIFIFTIMNI